MKSLPSSTTFNPSYMAFSHTQMPSFTLVLTSNWHFLYGYPTAIKLDPCALYTMLPVVINQQSPTIDLVGGPADNSQVYINQSTTHEEPPSIRMKKTVAGATKRYMLIAIRSLKKRFSGLANPLRREEIF